ncbi:protein sneaky-like isoform X2 [Anthonomus grandis grandis]|uniref:protein sneaky-like isoform X2 n=1 Tax=Anthonomus grandis grandis TaxID=2921223 RepID=UPI00216678CC|nr:protein sneaky-like isoform X2 [Anthonomus grandis grandis]
MSITLCFMLGAGISSSAQIRCITLLTFPAFGGRVGRSVLKALVITFIISGPLENLSNNGKEVVRVFACTASLTFNMTKTRFTLMFKPFTDAIFGMKTEVNEVKDTIRSIKDVSAPVTGEIEDEKAMKKIKEENDYLDELTTTKTSINDNKTNGERIEGERYEKKYLKKVETRCMGQFERAAERCRTMFETGYNKCYDTVTWVAGWLLCWPMKLDFVCNIAEALGGSSRCDPSKHIDAGFGEGYAYLKESRSSLSQNFKDVKLQYKLGKVKQLRDVRDARDTAVAILNKVKGKKEIFESIFNIIKRILAFIFLKIILSCQDYEEKYLKDIEFDNIYLTKYFRKIDARRKQQDKPTLLPLKKMERLLIVDPKTLKPLKTERESILRETFILVLEMITASTFILLDRLFYEALDLIRRHAKIDYLTTGKHDLLLQIKGTGMIAALLRSLVKGFNVKKRIKIERSNEQCLPKPQKLAAAYIFKIYGVYFAIWSMMWIQAYTQRLRRLICSYYFRKREKQRVLFLYNETLKRRKALFLHMKKTLERKARERRLEESYNICQILILKFPKRFSWLKIFKCARKKCLTLTQP